MFNFTDRKPQQPQQPQRPQPPLDHRPVLSDVRIGHEVSRKVREEYAQTLGTMNALISELERGDLSRENFIVLAKGAHRTMLDNVNEILVHSVAEKTYGLSRDNEKKGKL